jgi:hypothetical protein
MTHHGLSSFKQADLTRAVRALKAAGVKVERVEIGADGKVAVIVERNGKEESVNPWDEVLHGHSSDQVR